MILAPTKRKLDLDVVDRAIADSTFQAAHAIVLVPAELELGSAALRGPASSTTIGRSASAGLAAATSSAASTVIRTHVFLFCINQLQKKGEVSKKQKRRLPDSAPARAVQISKAPESGVSLGQIANSRAGSGPRDTQGRRSG